VTFRGLVYLYLIPMEGCGDLIPKIMSDSVLVNDSALLLYFVTVMSLYGARVSLKSHFLVVMM
jgi:hypothetical protein